MAKSTPSSSSTAVLRTSVKSKLQPQPKSDLNDVAQLVVVFPDIDRDYARMCLQSYTHNRVAAVTEKLLDKNFTNYPRHVPSRLLFSN
jgi:CUE domain